MKRELYNALVSEGFDIHKLPNGNYDVTGYPLGGEDVVCDIIGSLIDRYDNSYDVEFGGWDDDSYITIFERC